MTGRERIGRLLAGQPVDRPPVMASLIAAAAEARGLPQRRIHQEAETNAATLLGVCRELELDGAYISSDNWILYSALGGRVHFPEDDEPVGTGPVITEWEQMKHLRVPVPERDDRMSFMLEAARHAVRLNQGELFLEANIDSGPFQMAATLRGLQQFLEDIVWEPAQAHRLIEFCAEVVAAYATAMARTGVDAIQFGDSAASLINEKLYVEFVAPYQPSVIAAIRHGGVHPFLHVCGNTNHLTRYLANAGAACVELDAPADLSAAFRVFGDRSVLRGNVPTMVLRNATGPVVAEHARACLRAAGTGRLILSPGCGVPRGTPLGNIRTLVRVAGEGRLLSS